MAKGYLIDLDGVVWKGVAGSEKPIKGAAKKIAELRALGRKLVFITNAIGSPKEIVARLARMGIDCSEEEIVCAFTAAALYVRKRYGRKRVFVVGERGVADELRRQGQRIVKRNADVVVVGFDRQANYKKLDEAYAELQRGAEFVAVCPNPHYSIGSRLAIGTGALAAVLSTASGIKPFFAGKPSKFIGRLALARIGLKAGECALIGDSIEDVRMARGIGTKIVLVLSGVCSREEAEKHRVDYIKNSIAELNGNE